MKTLSLALACLLFLLAPVLAQAADFEGTLQVRFTKGDSSYEGICSLKTGLLRLDTEARGMAVSAIVDLQKMEANLLMPAAQMSMALPLKNAATQAVADADGATLEDTRVVEKILGHACTKYLVKTRSAQVTEIWAAADLGNFVSLSLLSQLTHRQGQAGAQWESVLKDKALFPLRVVTREADGSVASRFEILAIDAKPLPAEVFQSPPSFRQVDMGSMLQAFIGTE